LLRRPIHRKGPPIPQRSAGLLLYKREGGVLKVLLAHPGGPFWRRKDLGAWGIPKGLIEAHETAREAALREFTEETGFSIQGALLPLGEVIQRGGKHVEAWALEGDCDPAALKPFLFEMEWPPRSGRRAQFPEVDRVAWFTLAEARERILAGQAAFLDRLEQLEGSSRA
jgi:predicted NUDIX family NTP pyrophosphohydrolase